MDTKLIFVTGGVVSSLGKGITAATLVKAAYDYALANGMKPKATCSYAVRWLERHPELDKG